MNVPHPLLRAFPALAGRLPIATLGTFPTPVQRADGLAAALGLPAAALWVKRDDRSGAAYGGNKVRKLELLLGAALARGARRLITIGAVGSNHVLATTTYGRAAGLDVEAVVVPQPLTPAVRRNVLCDLALGATLHVASSYAAVPARVAALLGRGARPTVVIPPGGSSPLGTLGYVGAALELAAQVRAGELPEPDRLYVPLGTGGTVAGLALGLRLAGLATRVAAVRVVDRVVANAPLSALLARRAGRLLALRAGVDPPRVHARDFSVDHGFFGAGYGVPTDEGREAIALARESAGLELEPTYSGKAFAALATDARAGRLSGSRVLFWMTYSSADLSPVLARAPDPAGIPERLRSLIA